MKCLFAGIVIILACFSCYASSAKEKEVMSDSKISESYIMLYYKDMSAPRHFYADILGLESTLEDDWVNLYRLTGNSFVGVVKEGKTAYHAVQDTNAVMLSIVVDNVDQWYARVKSFQDVKILKEIYNNENVPIRAFLIADPGGYTIEIFQWLNKQNQR